MNILRKVNKKIQKLKEEIKELKKNLKIKEKELNELNGSTYTFNGFFGLFNSTSTNKTIAGGYKKNKKKSLTRKYKSN